MRRDTIIHEDTRGSPVVKTVSTIMMAQKWAGRNVMCNNVGGPILAMQIRISSDRERPGQQARACAPCQRCLYLRGVYNISTSVGRF